MLNSLPDSGVAQPICLPDSCSSSCLAGQGAMIAGWGAIDERTVRASTILQKAFLPITQHDVCVEAFSDIGQKITNNMICAGSTFGGSDTCFGDSGTISAPFTKFQI